MSTSPPDFSGHDNDRTGQTRPSGRARLPDTTDPWLALRAHTSARIGLGRVGNAMRTLSFLELRTAHALARDAVHHPLDVEALRRRTEATGAGTPVHVTSRAGDRSTYLSRPDLGRLPGDLTGIPREAADIGVVLCDGLSPGALERHGPPLLEALRQEMDQGLSWAQPVIATQARVALADHIGAWQRVTTTVVLIGERPGLSVPESLGIYVTHCPRPGRSDAERNCVSNIHPPEGLGYARAARITAAVVRRARALGKSGVHLKDTTRDPHQVERD
ncbi:ethanolamine ammonia-lyase subunit EutC [Streptomyces sp. NBC_01716]|uniref:ethanolamine ammonia-lyase subunit EutC n=1 Tax=Streptomyces sp. NBC_01716 TaxID=2975917 RepID=UPI002E35DDD7|nr:ethanolamine ammonia-lyase subunit EutC [Streptomyces sp. NBC_01716]